MRKFRGRYSQARLILGTVYDPTDGTGLLESGVRVEWLLPLLLELNAGLRELAAQEGLLLADIHAHFLGRAFGSDPWLYREIEPTQRGSSEIRSVFWNALSASG